MLRWLKRLAILMIMIVLLISNTLALTSSAFNGLLCGILAGATGIKSLSLIQNEALQNSRNAIERQKAAVQRIGSRLKARTIKIASREAVSNAFSWIPFAGTGVAIAVAVIELRDLLKA
ncbi:MAG: hypothetical protein Q8J78_09975 [Moraxellaceae bacterium]|nr:hypothetical protein [Moraxellaceae bacterium]